MTAPRLEVDLDAVCHNARSLVARLGAVGIRVTGVTKAVLGEPAVADALVRGGVVGLGDSRIENLTRLHAAGSSAPRTLIRSPMLSQADEVVCHANASLNTEALVLDALSKAAVRAGSLHSVLLMVELGDLREGIAARDVVDAACLVRTLPGLALAGLGTNLACQNGVVPDQQKMDELSRLVHDVEAACGLTLTTVSGGNSASIEWALTTTDVGRIDELRLGEAILIGTEPSHRQPIDGLRTDACTLVAEVIEVKEKPAQPWGAIAQTAFGETPVRSRCGTVRQAILALGRQDVDPDGLVPPPGMSVLGSSSDHLVLDVGDHCISVGDELAMGLDYSALLRSATSPFVTLATTGGV